MSVWNASTMMSHMSFMCSPMSCGMPSAGRGMFGLASVGRQPCSSPRLPAFSMRCSTSRTESRYSSSFCWSRVLMPRRTSFASASTASSTLWSPLLAESLNNWSKASAGYNSNGVGVVGELHEMCEL